MADQHTQEAVVMPMEEEESSLSVCSSSHLRSRGEQEQQASGIRSLSLSNLFSFRIAKRASSLDMDQLHIAAAADDAAAACAEQEDEQDKMMTKQQQAVCRSQSLPMTSIRRLQPRSHKKRARFRVSSVPVPVPESEQTLEAAAAAAEEEVGQEEAVCRICMVALWEGGSVLKLECRCKGELALAHRECAVRWFSIKGNANCDVCSHDVLNLPVTLRRIHSHSSDTSAAPPPPPPPALRGGLWQHGTPILVVVSILAYFCFLEQLLVGDHGTAALAISLPFAGVLGLFSSLTTTKMVSRRYVWIYSAFQFLFIVLFTHLFYRYVRLQAVIAIILSTFAGFAVTICGNAMALQIITWRLRLRRTPVSDLET